MAANEQRTTGSTGTERMRGGGHRLVTLKPGWAQYEYGPYERFPQDRQACIEGYLMQRYDPTIGSALWLIRWLVGSGGLGEYTHPDERTQEFVRANLDGLRGGRDRSIRALLSCLWSGFAVAAKQWRTDARGWALESLDLLHPLTLFSAGNRGRDSEGIRVGDSGEVEGFRQFPSRAGDEVIEYEREDVLYWPFCAELREEVYGRRLTDRARRSWFMRVQIERFWGVFLEKHAHPMPVFVVPKGMQQGPTGADIPNSQFYGEFISGLTAGQGLAIEADAEDKFDLRLLESGSSGDSYERAAAYHNAELFKSVLMSPMLLEEPLHGSRAQAGTALDLTLMLVEAIREELGGVLVQEVARPLIEYNLGATDDYGDWQWPSLRDDDLELLSRVLDTVCRTGIIRPNDADERKARELFAPAGVAAPDEITDADLAAAELQEQRDAEAAAAAQEARSAAATGV